MKIFKKRDQLKSFLTTSKKNKKTIGFVPTMGALHKGHLFLIEQAKKKNGLVVASIFVNPTQFNNQEDLDNYPKTLEKDIELLESVSCDVLFVPTVKEIYDENVVSDKFDFDGLEHEMEGKFRVGHFDGVGTIVKTLFEIVTPKNAYFGEKDFQQLQIIKKLVAKHQLPISIKGCEIFRENDGLAMSSRNARLTLEQRNAAPLIYKILKSVKKKFQHESVEEISEWVENQFKNHPILQLEYFTIADEKSLKSINIKEFDKKYRAFIAVFAGNIRLIDNIQLKN
ncbi:pantoate--beta-alanine ligase [Polaribacter sp.]|uniref:pantoate--beta-alanine ligase n=1 Tax=Polaribacter sp. TaxID=1920175 RepID=UPI004047D1CF